MMLSWLFKNKQQVPTPLEQAPSEQLVPDGFILPTPAQELLCTPRRQKLLTHIWQRTSLSRKQFEWMYLKPIERYTELVQLFPASEAHHHAYNGGMLDHGLEIMAYALKLRQSYLLPIGGDPEEQAAQAQVWSAAVAYAALLHDIGKIAVDLHVEYQNGVIWHPWYGALTKPYRFRYLPKREYKLHSASTGLLYNQILDERILDWLSQTPVLFSALLYVLAGQIEHAGILGEIVIKADQASVAQALGGDPAKAMLAPQHALQRKLLDGLRYLVTQELKLNNAGPSDGWLTDDGLWLVSKTVSDKLRAYLLSQGISGIPNKNSAIFDVMQEHGIILATPENKAIWNATVTSENSGWSHAFTFLKVSSALIWDDNTKPADFLGTVTINTEAMPVTVDIPDEKALQENHPEIKKANVPPDKQDVADEHDALSSVMDILGLGDVTNTVKKEDNRALPELITPEIKDEISLNMMSVDIKPKRSKKHLPKNTDETKEIVIESTLATQQVDTNPPLINATIDIHDAKHFMVWLKEAILDQKLSINEPQALVHTVADSIYIVTPGIFMRYVNEFPQMQTLAKTENLPSWRFIQKQFEKLKVHKKQENGLNIWTCTVKGIRRMEHKKIHGYLLLEPQAILPDILFNNPYLVLS